MHDELYRVSEVAKKLRCNTNTVYGLIGAGLIPTLKIGSLKVRKDAFIEFQQKWEGWDLSNPENPVRMSEGA